MLVSSEHDTIMKIIMFHSSISRYGDGELRLCLGHSAKLQRPHPVLAKRLQEILRSDLCGHIVAIPRIWDREDWPTEQKKQFWAKYSISKKYTSLFMPVKVYGSAFITRPDSVADIATESYFDLVKTIWGGKKVLLVQGAKGHFGKYIEEIFGKNVEIFEAPSENAFDEYDKILFECLRRVPLLNMARLSQAQETVIILSLGPAATVLAYDLCAAGRWALDMGHFAMFYPKILNGT